MDDDPTALQETAAAYLTTARTTQDAARQLRQLGARLHEVWQADSAAAFDAVLRQLPTALEAVRDAHSDAAMALQSLAEELARARASRLAAEQRQVASAARVSAAQRAIQHAAQLHRQQMAANPATAALAWMPAPTPPPLAAQLQRAAHDLAADRAAAGNARRQAQDAALRTQAHLEHLGARAYDHAPLSWLLHSLGGHGAAAFMADESKREILEDALDSLVAPLFVAGLLLSFTPLAPLGAALVLTSKVLQVVSVGLEASNVLWEGDPDEQGHVLAHSLASLAVDVAFAGVGKAVGAGVSKGIRTTAGKALSRRVAHAYARTPLPAVLQKQGVKLLHGGNTVWLDGRRRFVRRGPDRVVHLAEQLEPRHFTVSTPAGTANRKALRTAWMHLTKEVPDTLIDEVVVHPVTDVVVTPLKDRATQVVEDTGEQVVQGLQQRFDPLDRTPPVPAPTSLPVPAVPVVSFPGATEDSP